MASKIIDHDTYIIKKARCPKCGSDEKWIKSYYKGEPIKGAFELGQCTNFKCKIVTHTGNKLCQMNVCEWHEICAGCGKEICGDFITDALNRPIHDNCKDIIPKEYSFFG